MRKKIVAGNWKMNTSLQEGQKLASEVVNMVNDEVITDTQVILGVPFTHITTIKNLVEGSEVQISAQNCHQEESGAYTGEVSAPMLSALSISHVILGHSERRDYFGEGHQLLASKVDMALKASLIPIFCCGEKLEVREEGKHFELIRNQISDSLFHLDAETISKIVIAYEPVWAIGTGVTASSDQAQEMHLHIRKTIADQYDQQVADQIPILYGGSVKPGNAVELFSCPDVDGGLVGGASLKSRDFVDIIKAMA